LFYELKGLFGQSDGLLGISGLKVERRNFFQGIGVSGIHIVGSQLFDL